MAFYGQIEKDSNSHFFFIFFLNFFPFFVILKFFLREKIIQEGWKVSRTQFLFSFPMKMGKKSSTFSVRRQTEQIWSTYSWKQKILFFCLFFFLAPSNTMALNCGNSGFFCWFFFHFKCLNRLLIFPCCLLKWNNSSVAIVQRVTGARSTVWLHHAS